LGRIDAEKVYTLLQLGVPPSAVFHRVVCAASKWQLDFMELEEQINRMKTDISPTEAYNFLRCYVVDTL